MIIKLDEATAGSGVGIDTQHNSSPEVQKIADRVDEEIANMAAPLLKQLEELGADIKIMPLGHVSDGASRGGELVGWQGTGHDARGENRRRDLEYDRETVVTKFRGCFQLLRTLRLEMELIQNGLN